MKTVLATGGAGFIGSHLVDALLLEGYSVRVMDAPVAQVHGANAETPRYLPDEAEFIRRDVADVTAWREALQGVDVVFHEAAKVGVGQSMIVGRFREGDVSHCYAHISNARRVLGYEPKVTFEDGISDLVQWVRQEESLDLVDSATRELEMRGPTK